MKWLSSHLCTIVRGRLAFIYFLKQEAIDQILCKLYIFHLFIETMHLKFLVKCFFASIFLLSTFIQASFLASVFWNRNSYDLRSQSKRLHFICWTSLFGPPKSLHNHFLFSFSFTFIENIRLSKGSAKANFYDKCYQTNVACVACFAACTEECNVRVQFLPLNLYLGSLF